MFAEFFSGRWFVSYNRQTIVLWTHKCGSEADKLLVTRMYIGNNSVCVIKFHFIFFCYSLKNIIPLILSGNIPNEICRNDTYKVLNGLWQIKPWALSSKYSLYGCEDCCPPILICASQKTEEKYFVGSTSALPMFLHGLESDSTFIFLILLFLCYSKLIIVLSFIS